MDIRTAAMRLTGEPVTAVGLPDQTVSLLLKDGQRIVGKMTSEDGHSMTMEWEKGGIGWTAKVPKKLVKEHMIIAASRVAHPLVSCPACGGVMAYDDGRDAYCCTDPVCGHCLPNGPADPRRAAVAADGGGDMDSMSFTGKMTSRFDGENNEAKGKIVIDGVEHSIALGGSSSDRGAHYELDGKEIPWDDPLHDRLDLYFTDIWPDEDGAWDAVVENGMIRSVAQAED